MRNMKPVRRYCLAAILIISKSASAIDDIVSILIRWVRKLHTDGSQFLDDYRLKHLPETDSLVELLHKILSGIKSTGTPSERLMTIENSVTQGTDKAIIQCEEYMLYAGDNYLPFMLKPYSNKRSIIFELIEQLDIRPSSQDDSLIKALEFIKTHRNSHKEWLDIKCLGQEHGLTSNLNFLSEKWFKPITGKTKCSCVTQIHRKYYELAVLSTLVDDLDCGNVYVADANVYDDPNKQLISWDQFDDELEEYCALVKMPSKQEDFIAHLQKEMRDAACKTDTSYLSNTFLHIENGLPVLKKSPAKENPSDLEKISQAISEQMPLTNIVEIIVDVEKWLNLSAYFKPLSGYETKIPNYRPRFVATSFAYGCNVGPTESERCLPGFSRKQIAWLFNRHITETNLEKALTKLINYYNKFDLPKNWGTGESVSADGTYCDMYQQNLMAEYHIRYGNYGGLGYYHVSDLYIALYGNFIPCGVYEGNYIFDGINANESEVKPNKVHGDTGVQSEVIFGFALLLSIQLMPRIRDFKHLRYYKASKTDQYSNINEIFSDERIDWNLIKRHYYDMLRLIMSIRTGRIKASTILRKLNSKNRKNKLYYAFRELGRVARTIFLLNYINDIDLRRMIQAATCKSEEFNDFIKWVRFGSGGTISDNMRYNQRKIIKYGQLIANMVMLHVVANATKVINDLRSGGLELSNDILEHLSPFRTEHINRLGVFQLDIEKTPMELEYKLVKKVKE
jgi:TnpA family transposase